MSAAQRRAARRAARLVRCYPPAWRARYGEEFTALLVDDIAERPRSLRRDADVLANGLLARLNHAGLAGAPLAAERQLRASLIALGCALAAFLTVGIAMWSQLEIGWRWSAPSAPATRVAVLMMSGAALSFGVLALLAALPLGYVALRALARREAAALIGPMLLALGGATVLVLGSRHFGHGWPGTGGHRWAQQGLVPSEIAADSWAATLWVSSYWGHPAALRSFPASEVAWMVASPLALLAALAGAARTLRRLPLSARVLRYELALGALAAATMAAFLAGAGSWVISGGAAPRGLYRAGVIDSAGLAVMTLALVTAFRLLARALAARREAPAAG